MTTRRSKLRILLATLLGLSALNQTALAAATNTFTPEQKTAIEQIVHDYLVAHPTVLIEATQALQKQQQQEMVSRAESAIKDNAKSLFNQAESPVIGNPKGNVTLIEFFDYQCSVCQNMAPIIDNLIKNNPNLRVVFKEWPIFGKTSAYAAKAALASVKQGKFAAFYNALITNQGHLTQEKILILAKTVNLNVEQLKKDIKNPAFDAELKHNLKLAEAMRLIGTPAFIIARTPNGVYTDNKTYFVPGGAQEETLQELIKKTETA